MVTCKHAKRTRMERKSDYFPLQKPSLQGRLRIGRSSFGSGLFTSFLLGPCAKGETSYLPTEPCKP